MNEQIKQRQRAIPHSFEDQLSAFKQRLERQIARLQEGPEKAALQEKICQVERAIDLNRLLSVRWDQHDPDEKAR